MYNAIIKGINFENSCYFIINLKFFDFVKFQLFRQSLLNQHILVLNQHTYFDLNYILL